MQFLASLILAIIGPLLCHVSAASLPSGDDSLFPTSSDLSQSPRGQMILNQTLPSLVCDRGPFPGDFRPHAKLPDRYCQRLAAKLRAHREPYNFSPHKKEYFPYRTCIFAVQGGSGHPPFTENLSSISDIAEDIMRRCDYPHFGGTRVDFRTGWHVQVYSPKVLATW